MFVVIHLMIAGRFRWMRAAQGEAETKPKAGPKTAWRVRLHQRTLRNRASPKSARRCTSCAARPRSEHDTGGLEVLTASSAYFAARLRLENRRSERALTDPRLSAHRQRVLRRDPARGAAVADAIDIHLSDEQTVHYSRASKAVRTWANATGRRHRRSLSEKVTAFREGWPCTADTASPAPVWARPFSASSTPPTSATTAAVPDRGRSCGSRLSRLLGKDWRGLWRTGDLSAVIDPRLESPSKRDRYQRRAQAVVCQRAENVAGEEHVTGHIPLDPWSQ